MSFWDDLKTRFQRADTAAPEVKADVPFIGRGASGGYQFYGNNGNIYPWPSAFQNTKINYAQEVGDPLSSSLVMAAVNWFGTALPEAPIQVLKRKTPKVFEPLPEHPLVQLLDSPNPFDTGEDLWASFALSWLIDGNVYWRKLRNAMGKVIELWYEPHFLTRARWPEDGSEFVSYYEVNRGGAWYRVETQDMLHFRNGRDPENYRYGLSPIASILREIFTDNERANYSALLMKNCGRISHVLSPKETASDIEVDVKAIKEEVMYQSTGDNSFKPIVLSGPIEMNKLALSPDEMAISVLARTPEFRLAAVTRIPAVVLQFEAGWEHSHYSNLQEAREDAYEGMLIPTQRRIAAQIRRQLLPEFEPASNNRDEMPRPDPAFTIGFDLSQVRVLQEDRDSLFKREIDAYRFGVKKRGEARSALGLETTPDDDVFYAPSTQVSPDPLTGGVPDLAGNTELPLQQQQKLNGKASKKDEEALLKRKSATKSGLSTCAKCNELYLKGNEDWDCGGPHRPLASTRPDPGANVRS